jgi:DNA-binding LacI/PurR family transcriptional regulator
LAEEITVIAGGGETESSGAEAASSVLHMHPMPTAVLTFNDRCAVGLIDSLIRAGMDIPHTISVIGYDDSPVAQLGHVNLTTVSQNTHQLTSDAISALIDRLDNDRTAGPEVVVAPRLIVRGTTGPPPN